MRRARYMVWLLVVALPAALSAGQTATGLTGRWTPQDPARADALFDVGLQDITGAGMRIEQRGDTLRIVRYESNGALARLQQVTGRVEVQSVYTLEAARTDTTGSSASATWDGRRLVIESTSPQASRRVVYSIENGALKAVTSVSLPNGASNTVVLYYDRADR